jgi:hypothetical protein
MSCAAVEAGMQDSLRRKLIASFAALAILPLLLAGVA